ncbi:MAG: PhzF family phenazine biosynthesis protein [Opitutaceae bacterium]
MQIEYYTAEAFTEHPFHGAQITVFPEAKGLNLRQMQKLAAEMNLSETVFVTAQRDNSFAIRVFSPLKEIEFAGHPMIATGHVLASLGKIDLATSPGKATFQLHSGPVDLLVHGTPGKPELIQFSMTASAKFDYLTPPESEIAESLGIEVDDICTDTFRPIMATRDQTYLIVPVKSFNAVRKAVFNHRLWTHSSAMMVSEILLFSSDTEEPQHDFHGRLLGPDIGVREDPPIGSSMPVFTSYLHQQSNSPEGSRSFSIERGTLETRQSILNVEAHNDGSESLSIKVGGPAIAISQGAILVPVEETLLV